VKCPNCGDEHAELPSAPCLLAVLLGLIVHDRETMTHEQAQAALAKVDVDALWTDLGPILDRLEDGAYGDDHAGRRWTVRIQHDDGLFLADIHDQIQWTEDLSRAAEYDSPESALRDIEGAGIADCQIVLVDQEGKRR
jgi:hypothetical protein